MSLGSRIKERREQLDLSRNDLAIKIGVTPSAIANYENEISSPKIELMYKLFDALECDANYLHQDDMKTLVYENSATLEEFENIVKKYRSLDNIGKNHIDYEINREIKRVEEIEKLKEQSEQLQHMNMEVAEEILPVRIISYYQKLASAGNGQVIFDDTAVDRIEIPDIPKYKRVSYAIGVNGHSMEPLYYDGDILLIEPTCEIEVGEIGIFIVDGQAFVKKLGVGELISLNKGYGNIKLTEYSNCMGRVVDKLQKD